MTSLEEHCCFTSRRLRHMGGAKRLAIEPWVRLRVTQKRWSISCCEHIKACRRSGNQAMRRRVSYLLSHFYSLCSESSSDNRYGRADVTWPTRIRISISDLTFRIQFLVYLSGSLRCPRISVWISTLVERRRLPTADRGTKIKLIRGGKI